MANSPTKDKTPIFKSLEEIENYMKENAGLGKSFDLGVRKLSILSKGVHIYYVNGLCDTQFIIEIVEELVEINDHEHHSKNIYDIIENRLVHQSVTEIKTMDEIVDQVLSGLIAVVVEDAGAAFIVDVRSYPGRTPMEPDTEKVVRGSRDGFVENIIINTALTRRRIRDGRLRFEIMRVGERGKTDIAIGYIEGLANQIMLKSFERNFKILGSMV